MSLLLTKNKEPENQNYRSWYEL